MIAEDVRQRRNLDVYVTIVLAAVVAVLSYFDLVPAAKTASTVLAVLAVLAFNVLATRAAIEARRSETVDRFHRSFPSDMVEKRESCDDVLLVGVSLSRTLDASYAAFDRNLQRGYRLRILLTSPQADAAALDARGQVSRPAIADIRHEIENTLRQLAGLKQRVGGNLEVRVTRAALKFGLQFLRPEQADAEMHVQLYSYRLPGESRPMFTLRRQDGEWFDCFAVQAQALWDEAEEFNLEAVVL